MAPITSTPYYFTIENDKAIAKDKGVKYDQHKAIMESWERVKLILERKQNET